MELEINKAKTEEATLKDALLKMQAMNEGLGQDKVELNKIIMQVTTHTPPSQILTGLILRRQCVCRERDNYMHEWKITLMKALNLCLSRNQCVCMYMYRARFPCKSGKILTFYESLNIHEVKSFFCFSGFIFFFNLIISNIFGITIFF